MGAQARAEATEIEGQASVSQARLRVQSMQIESNAEMEQAVKRNAEEIEHKTRLDQLELERAAKLAEIEGKKFKNLIDAIGADTIKSIAQAGPEMQAKLVSGLGIKSMLITDGNSPINLFNTAS